MTATVSAYIGIGANLGDPEQTVIRAIAALQALTDTQLSASSSLFASAPVDAGGDDFINAVARIDTGLSAENLLSALQAIEQTFSLEVRHLTDGLRHTPPPRRDGDLRLRRTRRIRGPG